MMRTRQLIKSILAWLSRRPAPQQQGHPVTPRHNEPVEPPRQRDRREVEETGRWYLKRDILEQLDKYFSVIAEFRRADPDAYAIHGRLGAVLVNQQASWARSDWERVDGRIAFGAIYTHQFARLRDMKTVYESGEEEFVPPLFVYFRKWRRGLAYVELTRPSETIYEVTALYPFDFDKIGKGFWPVPVHVAVDGDGAVRVLRELKVDYQGLPSGDVVAHKRWCYPRWLSEIAAEHEHSIQDQGAFLFHWAYHTYREASMDMRVMVDKGNLTAAFALDTFRTPYFFKDRDMVLTPTGKRERIWHHVRVHERNTKWGKTYVRSHFRGARDFMWNGYRVRLSMPGREHSDLLDLEFSGIDMKAHHRTGARVIGSTGVGKHLRKMVTHGTR